jgi:hypothetical protein
MSSAMSSDMSSMSSETSSMSSESSSMSSEMSSASSMPMVTLKYSINITNMTSGQPFSPTAYVLHQPGYKAFETGMAVTIGVEKIAESGNPTDFLAEADALETTLTSGRAESVLMPGNSTELSLMATLEESGMTNVQLSLLSMLGNTNDGLTAINGWAIGHLTIGESMTLTTLSYDAGTEANSETMESVPGPIAGGEGFNAARDDIADKASLHPGAITQIDDASSALTSMQRWDNPVARITITRIEP